MRTQNRPLSIGALALLALCVSAFYIGIEWLFFVTKASFFNSFSLIDRIGALLVSIAGLTSITFASGLVVRRIAWSRKPTVAMAPYTLVVGAAVFLTLDGILYNVRLGVVRSGTITRFLYLILLIWLLWQTSGWLNLQVAKIIRNSAIKKKLRISALSYLALTLSYLGFKILVYESNELAMYPRGKTRPNIIFLATDGIDAAALSAYGLKLDTSPFLKTLAGESLLVENAFTNAGQTTGSTISMLNGISPLRTKVGFPPQVLPQAYAFRHLPALLRNMGYVGFQQTVRHYADAGDSNMQSGFTWANDRPLFAPAPRSIWMKFFHFFNVEYLFATQLSDRLSSRLLHITGIRKINTQYLILQQDMGYATQQDHDSTSKVIEFIAKSAQPFFVHLHLEATHCCGYQGAPSYFSAADAGGDPSLARKYSAVKNADMELKRVYDALKTKGILDQSIIIITSDHSPNWDTIERLPLIIRFPKRAHKGRVTQNVSFTDIAPTLLDYMGIPTPNWMTGQSILPSQIPLKKPHWIHSFSRLNSKRLRVRNAHLMQTLDPGPPLYGVATTVGIYCHVWKKLNLLTGEVQSGQVVGHTHPCAATDIPSDAEFKRTQEQKFKAEGFRLPRTG